MSSKTILTSTIIGSSIIGISIIVGFYILAKAPSYVLSDGRVLDQRTGDRYEISNYETTGGESYPVWSKIDGPFSGKSRVE